MLSGSFAIANFNKLQNKTDWGSILIIRCQPLLAGLYKWQQFIGFVLFSFYVSVSTFIRYHYFPRMQFSYFTVYLPYLQLKLVYLFIKSYRLNLRNVLYHRIKWFFYYKTISGRKSLCWLFLIKNSLYFTL